MESPRLFADLLGDGLWAVKRQTGKNIQDIEDEIGYSLGRNGRSWVQWLRKGHLPPTLHDIEQIAKLIIASSKLGKEWCYALFVAGGHPYPDSAITSLFDDPNANDALYDLFVCCHTHDLVAAETLAEQLAPANLRAYIDKWHLLPEQTWQAALEYTLSQCRACVLLFGSIGSGPWEHEQFRTVLTRLHRAGTLQIIPILLPSGVRGDLGRLPDGVRDSPWITFQSELTELEPLRQLLARLQDTDIEESIQKLRCPYQGLQYFDEEHTAFFFGRASDVQRLVEELGKSRFVAVLGPSGSGKSSLVRAGLLPTIKAGALDDTLDYHSRIILPGAHPLEALAHFVIKLLNKPTDVTISDQIDAFSADEKTLHYDVVSFCEPQQDDTQRPKRLILVIDQFEELFSLCHNMIEREAFLDNLLFASSIERGYLTVVITMRADFYHHCADYPQLAARITEHQLLVGLIRRNELIQVIEKPAKMMGRQVEAALTQLLLNDVGSEPGMLPLLQHTLTELWDHHVAGQLVVKAYLDIGGVKGSVAQWAEQLYQKLYEPEKERARQLFLALVQPGVDAEDTKRRVTLEELIDDVQERVLWEELVNKLAAQRVVVVSRTINSKVGEDAHTVQIELVHEALIREWSRLRNWINEERESLHTHRWLSQRASEWDAAGRPVDTLLSVSQMGRLRTWQATYHQPLSILEQTYLRQSKRRYRRTRLRVVTLLIGISLSLGIYGAMFVWQARSSWQPLPAANFTLVTTIAPLADDRICVGTSDEGMHCRLLSETQWQPKKLGLKDGQVSNLTGDSVHRLDHLTVDPIHTDRHYVAVYGNGLYETSVTQDRWYKISAAVQATMTLDLAVYNEQVYALFQGQTAGAQLLYVSPNSGKCWAKVGQVSTCWSTGQEELAINLPTPIHALAVSPSVQQVLLGSGEGLWKMRWQPPWTLEQVTNSPKIVTHIEAVPNQENSWYLVSPAGNDSSVVYQWQDNIMEKIATLPGKLVTLTATPRTQAKWKLFALLTSGEIIAIAADNSQWALGQPPNWYWINSVVYDIRAFVDPLDSDSTWLLLGNWQGLYDFQEKLD